MNPASLLEPEIRSTLLPAIPSGARILIVCEEDSDTERLRALLFKAGFVPDCVKSLAAGCEAAMTGQFQVVISTPKLKDGSWRRLADIVDRNNLHFEIILWARNFDLREWSEALNDGAFDVLDAVYEQPRAVEAAKTALWSAYLKGAGPNARAVRPCKVA
jgi:DNA-binding NtrC family response regulator